jgi:hypothetical protein
VTKSYRPISLKKVRRHSLRKRKSMVTLEAMGRPFTGGSFSDFLETLPDILAGKDFKSIVASIERARNKGRPVVLGMGAHPLKVGLSPLIVHLMREDVITAVAMNGAGIVHDYELSLMGQTSEDVADELCRGTFGMALETGRDLNRAIRKGVAGGYGIGKSVGDHIRKIRAPHRNLSILATASELKLPATVHVALGTDIIHMHPESDGASTGEGSMRDFRLFTSVISDLRGGVYINMGSAVIMPEVFLKSIAVARNLGHVVKNFTTVSLDFFRQYRVSENVLTRPVLSGGSSYEITGHHELTFPLLAAAIMEKVGR